MQKNLLADMTVKQILAKKTLKSNYSHITNRLTESLVESINVDGKEEASREVLLYEGGVYEALVVKNKETDISDVYVIEGCVSLINVYGCDLSGSVFKYNRTNATNITEGSIETSPAELTSKGESIKSLLASVGTYDMDRESYNKHLNMRGYKGVTESCLPFMDSAMQTLLLVEGRVEFGNITKDSEALVITPVDSFTDIVTIIEAPGQVSAFVDEMKQKTKAVFKGMAKLPKKLWKVFKGFEQKLRAASSEYRRAQDTKIKERVLNDEIIPAIDDLTKWLASIGIGYAAWFIPVVGPVVAVIGFVVTQVVMEDKTKKTYARALKIFDNEIEIVNKKIEQANNDGDQKAVIALTRAKQALADEKEKHVHRTRKSFN